VLPVESDVALLTRLQAGDEQAFVALVSRYQGSLIRVARSYVPSDAVAEEVVQDTWIGVLRGVDRFEGRSSFKTWLFRILVNRARTSGVREKRHLPLDPGGPAVSPDRFDGNGAWSAPVTPWESEADDRIVAASWAPRFVTRSTTFPNDSGTWFSSVMSRGSRARTRATSSASPMGISAFSSTAGAAACAPCSNPNSRRGVDDERAAPP
jgi:DNA-directed RNA polymerase specialized sigma24 family protein